MLENVRNYFLGKKALTQTTEPEADLFSHGRAEFEQDPMLQRELSIINADPRLRAGYEKLIMRGDQEALRQKSERQLQTLTEMYYGPFSLTGLLERKAKQHKLERAREWVRSLRPTRADEDRRKKFESPRRTGHAASFGALDVLVDADSFVYGSFDKITHTMARSMQPNFLREDELAPRAQLLMNDVVNVTARHGRDGKTCMESYMTNMFDYRVGKEILAVYIAMVCDEPEHAESLFRTDPANQQHWDEYDGLYVNDRSYEGDDWIAHNEKLSKTYTDRVKAIMQKTGIEPPLSLEVRVRDYAYNE